MNKIEQSESMPGIQMDLDMRIERLSGKIEDNLCESFEIDHWEGCLSSSALAVAVSVIALRKVDSTHYSYWIESGIHWLSHNANEDGGFGDTKDCPSNLSTSLLAWCAFQEHTSSACGRLEAWIQSSIGGLDAVTISRAVLNHYGTDRTFSVPILMTCALCGRLGSQPWKFVPQLPFELAALPRAFYRFVGLQVVSYALPALIAIGWGRHHHSHNALNPLAWIRKLLRPMLFRTLERVQPENGGYLEAIPLTAFVVMNLATSGFRKCAVVVRGISFLLKSMRPDGGWPIDTHLATWSTSLSIQALGSDFRNTEIALKWLLRQQHTIVHSFTGARPGGWAWTSFAGGVPDADDTSAALLAIRQGVESGIFPSIKLKTLERGVRWLLELQNRDGGMPTFCRGWGKLPFDQSCPDITANAMRAFLSHRGLFSGSLHRPIIRALRQGFNYLKQRQRKDGSWVPLWFGNPWLPNHENPVYGTSRVLVVLKELDVREYPECAEMMDRGLKWLLHTRNDDGGWGCDGAGKSTVEETALALEALAGFVDSEGVLPAINGAVRFLENKWENPIKPTPIGLYFASLWYSETLYPVVFSLLAMRALKDALEKEGRWTEVDNAS